MKRRTLIVSNGLWLALLVRRAQSAMAIHPGASLDPAKPALTATMVR